MRAKVKNPHSEGHGNVVSLLGDTESSCMRLYEDLCVVLSHGVCWEENRILSVTRA